jgi:molybdate transport system substrate-binding protein
LEEETVKYLLWSIIVAFLLANSCGARAQTEITLLAPIPMGREMLPNLIEGFENRTNDKVEVTFAEDSRDSEPFGTKQLVARGGDFDVSILFAPFREALASGNIIPGSATSLARLVLAVTVRKGAPLPDISTPAAVKQMLLAAKFISIVDPSQGSLGGEAMEVFKKLGIVDQMQPKIKAAQNSALAEAAVAKGETDLFLGPQLSDKLAVGVDVVIVGGLPRGASTPVDAVGFVSTHAVDPKAAKALLQYLKTPEAEEFYKAARMLPAH